MKTIKINEAELQFSYIRTPGPGGQNVNKVATGVHLRFNVLMSSSLPETVRHRLLLILGNKLTQSGDIIIKACRYRTQPRNKIDALERLNELIQKAQIVPKARKKSKPTAASKRKRLETKKRHSEKKSSRASRPKDTD